MATKYHYIMVLEWFKTHKSHPLSNIFAWLKSPMFSSLRPAPAPQSNGRSQPVSKDNQWMCSPAIKLICT